MTHLKTMAGLALAAALLAAPGFAQEAAAPAPAPRPASDAELAGLRGGADTHTTIAMTEQDLTAVNSGNRITAGVVGSGAISLSDNALSNFGGIGNVVMNTGHNNNLQSSMSVTIIVTD